MIKNPNSLLTRFFGLHRVKTSLNPRRIYFVVMGNIFPPNKDIHEIYDLKVFFYISALCRALYREESQVKAAPQISESSKTWTGFRMIDD